MLSTKICTDCAYLLAELGKLVYESNILQFIVPHICHNGVETRSGHQGNPGQMGHNLCEPTRSSPDYKNITDRDSALTVTSECFNLLAFESAKLLTIFFPLSYVAELLVLMQR